MLCTIIVQAQTPAGETVSIISDAWHLATIPRVGERIHLMPTTHGMDQFGYVNSVSHHLASGDYFQNGTTVAATLLLTANIYTVEHLTTASKMWHRI
jgi:hypothetical protein